MESKPEASLIPPGSDNRVLSAPAWNFKDGGSRSGVETVLKDGKAVAKGIYHGSLGSGGGRKTLRYIADLGEDKNMGIQNPEIVAYTRVNELDGDGDGGKQSFEVGGEPHTDDGEGDNIHVTFNYGGGDADNVQVEDDDKNFEKLSLRSQNEPGNILGKVLGVKIISRANADGTRSVWSYIDTSAFNGGPPKGTWKEHLRFTTVDTGPTQQAWIRMDGVTSADVLKFEVKEHKAPWPDGTTASPSLPSHGSPGNYQSVGNMGYTSDRDGVVALPGRLSPTPPPQLLQTAEESHSAPAPAKSENAGASLGQGWTIPMEKVFLPGGTEGYDAEEIPAVANGDDDSDDDNDDDDDKEDSGSSTPLTPQAIAQSLGGWPLPVTNTTRPATSVPRSAPQPSATSAQQASGVTPKQPNSSGGVDSPNHRLPGLLPVSWR